MSKKYFGLLLAVALLFQFTPVYPTAAASSEAFERNAQLLRALDVTVGSNAETVLTRGEFIAAIAQLMDLRYHGAAASFQDLSAKHDRYESIMAAAAAGLVFGNEQGEIAADLPVTASEAETIALRALGYGDMMKAGMAHASAISASGLRKGVNAGETVTWENAAAMLVNAAQAELMEMTAYGEGAIYSKDGGETLLSRSRNIYKAEGVLDGNDVTRLTVSSGLPAGMVSIDGVRYYAGYTGAAGLLGCRVEAYYEQDKTGAQDRTLWYIAPDSRNEIHTIRADEIVSYDNREFVYESDGKRKRISFDRNADVLYNHAPLLEVTKENLSIRTGSVTLIDRDGNGLCEAVLVHEFETYVVESVLTADHKIIAKYPAAILDVDNSTRTVILQNQQGEKMGLDELSEWDVLCVYTSKGGEKQTLVYSPKETEGTVEAITQEENGRLRITVDGVEFRTSQFMQTSGQLAVEAGKYYLFYLDASGEIAAYNSNFQSKYSCGYMIKIMRTGGIDDTVKVKMLTADGTIAAFTLNVPVQIDGVKYKTGSDAYAALGAAAFVPQLVYYSANEENEINYLDTAQRGEENEDTLEMYYSGYTFEDGVHTKKTSLSYRSATKIFDGKVGMTDATMVMTVPNNPADASDDDYNVRSAGWFINEKSYSVEAYKTTKAAHNADVILVYVNAGSATGLSDTKEYISVIDKVSVALDENEEQQYRVSFYRAGVFRSALTKNPEVLDNIKIGDKVWKPGCGDVVRFEIDENGKITYCELNYVRETDTMVTANPSSAAFTAIPRFQLAYAYEKYGNNLWTTRNELTPGTSYSFDFSGSDLESRPISGYHMVVYDEVKHRLRAGTAEDVIAFTNTGNQMCSTLFIDDRYGNPRTLVVYNTK